MSSSGTVLSHSGRYGDVHASDDARVHLGNRYTVYNCELRGDVRQNLLASLSFPQISDRRAQISNACPDTYRWVLDGSKPVPQRWACFRSWLSAKHGVQEIYWISGKPGSGKSTLMKFLDDEIQDDDLAHWADGQMAIRLNHFFWSSGNKLQRSTEGLLRHLILQILDQCPHVVDCVIQSHHGITAEGSAISWSVARLADVVRDLLRIQQADFKFFIMIDGLDECEDYDAPDAELLKYLSDFSAFTNVKLCVSSRPLNVFQDAFAYCPQLRLEYLTYLDMQTFVSSKLRTSPGWRLLSGGDNEQAPSFIRKIVTKAEGVFLWAALVVRNILEGLRDGDDHGELSRRLDDIPADLEMYFTRIIESIEEQYRCEASILFQLALWREDQYHTLTPFRLVDTIFLSMPSGTLDIESKRRTFVSQLQDPRKFQLVVDSLTRKLNSRSKGLLECTGGGEIISLACKISSPSLSPDLNVDDQDNGENASASALDWLDRMFCMQIKPIHRSLRDFLLISDTRTLLYRYTGGQAIDARSWLIEARLARLMALNSLSFRGEYVAGLVSFLMCSMSANGPSDRFTYALSLISGIVEHFAGECQAQSYWYIYPTFKRFHKEQSTFLSMAIDFGFTNYVFAYMTPTEIRAKQGRPILDHILRPRYALSQELYIFNRCPNIAILEAALRLGADPNERIGNEGPSIWAAYLYFLADYICTSAYSYCSPEAQLPWVQALQVLINYGASPVLPMQWLVSQSVLDTRGRMRWRGVSLSEHITNHGCEGEATSMYAVSNLLRSLQTSFAYDITPIVQDLEMRELAVSSSKP